MDLELRCPFCRDYYQSAILLPCSHSLCYSCALSSVQSTGSNAPNDSTLNLSFSSSDLSQLSFHSDNDSGVVVQRSSTDFLPPALPEISSSRIFLSTCSIFCRVCSKTLHFDSIDQIRTLPSNRLLNDIVQRYREENSSMRRSIVENRSFCSKHRENPSNFFCLWCRIECCENCSSHIEHEIVSINQAAKQSKTQISAELQNLSEKAKRTADFLTKLKFFPDLIKKNGENFQEKLIDEIDEIIANLEKKKNDFIDLINVEVERKIEIVERQYSSYNEQIQRTTGFLQFSIEALKQNDAAAFLQISPSLNQRCSMFNDSFSTDYECKSQTSSDLELQLNTDQLYRELNRLKFQQIKPPATPRFLAEQCFCRNSSEGILTWMIDDVAVAQGFVLELDDGSVNSDFREIYDGTETMCAIDGLLPSNIYTARVKAYNQAGESSFSQCLTIYSSSSSFELSTFTFHRRLTHPDIEFFSSTSDSISSVSLQERVALGSRAFRQGVHYWEFVIQRYDGQPDPAFGVARFDVSKENMLGKDSKSWCMYVDSERSWFMHNGQHTNRLNGGIRLGSIIGVLLDLNDRTLKFFIDRQQRGSVAFSNFKLNEVFYPAVSLNKNVHLTVVSGLQPP